MITFRQSGNFTKTEQFLKKTGNALRLADFTKYGEEGVAALKAATPVDSGKTADSWSYKIETSPDGIAISFHNVNIQNGVPIAIILQYGHASRSGSWVEGRDYISPAIQPVFDRIAKDAWKEVTKT